MRQCLGTAALLLGCALLFACGSSEQATGPSGGGAAQQTGPRAGPAAGKMDPEAARQHMLDLVVWGSSEPARDRDADAKTCTDKVAPEGGTKQGTHPLVTVHRWLECMEGLGWSPKPKG